MLIVPVLCFLVGGCKQNVKNAQVQLVEKRLNNCKLILPSSYTINYSNNSLSAVITNGTCELKYTGGYFVPQVFKDYGEIIMKERKQKYIKIIRSYNEKSNATIVLYIWDSTFSTKLFKEPRFKGHVYIATNVQKKQTDTILSILKSVSPAY